MACSKKKRFLC